MFLVIFTRRIKSGESLIPAMSTSSLSTALLLFCSSVFFMLGSAQEPMRLGKFLLMSDERQKNVFQIDVDTGEVRPLTISQGFDLTAMTFDPPCNCFYHFDRINQIVMKTTLDNGYIQTLFNANGKEIINLAVDSANRILFYIDQPSNTISTFQLLTSVSTIFLSEQGSQPTAIVLDVINGFLYWSDCGRQTIERSSISNVNINRMSAVTGLVSCVNTLAIDSKKGVIYWGDSGGSLETARLNGNSRSMIYRDQNAAYTGLTLDSRFLYIADSNKRQIQKLDRTSFQIKNLTSIVFTRPYSIVYYSNETVQTTKVTSSASSSRPTTTKTTTTTTTTTAPAAAAAISNSTTTTAAATTTARSTTITTTASVRSTTTTATTTAIASSTTTTTTTAIVSSTTAIASAVIPTFEVSSSGFSSLGAVGETTTSRLLFKGEEAIGINVIILVSVISGASVLIAVFIAIAVIAYKKCRSRPSRSDPVNVVQPSIHYEVEHSTVHPLAPAPHKPLYDVISYASPAYESIIPYSPTPPSYYAELNNRAYENEDIEQQ